jgi:hypothetical protein
MVKDNGNGVSGEKLAGINDVLESAVMEKTVHSQGG